MTASKKTSRRRAARVQVGFRHGALQRCDLSNFQELKKIEKEKGKETKGTETQEKALWPQRRSVFPPRIWLPLSWLFS